MKRILSSYTFFYEVIALVFLSGCGNSNSEIGRLIAERDSLRNETASQTERLNNYEQTVSLLNNALDSIAYEEKMIFVNVENLEMPVTKDIVKQNLERFENILSHQKNHIRQLEAKLQAANDSTNRALGLISHLKEQISAKDVQIAQLKKEIEKKNVDIARLQEQVESQQFTINSQSVTIDELNKRNHKQNEALAKQDAILNNGYVLIGTKSDLQRKGVLKKGHLVADAIMDRSKFWQIDMRTWKEVTFTAKKPRILTNMPVSSYEITTSGDKNFTLHIINPSDFWKISSYLVIQTD